MSAAPHEAIVHDYAVSQIGCPTACEDVQAACRRYLDDLASGRYDFDPSIPEFVIAVQERLFCHQQGESLDGTPLRGTPFLQQPWQMFATYNLCGFLMPGTRIRRYQEALLMLARKNGKTPYATSLIWALGLYYSTSGSRIKTVAGSLKQNMEGFGFLRYNLHRLGMTVDEDPAHGLRELDSSLGHSYSGDIWHGNIAFEALAYKPDIFDAFNANLVHLDELELYRDATPYGRLRDATKAYSNKLILATTTAGDNGTGFAAQRVDYCSRIVRGENTGPDADRTFAFIARAPMGDDGEVDYLNPVVQQMANPSWGVTIRPTDMAASAAQAKDDPQMRGEFLSRSLNVFVACLRAWFDVEEFARSDARYDWSLPELAKMVRHWYGGADLSKLHDLTALCLVGEIPAAKATTADWTPPEDVLVIIPHCWFPRTAAVSKADEDGIPLFGWEEDGWLDMPNEASMDPTEPVKQLKKWRSEGYKIRKIGHDRKFARAYIAAAKAAGFAVVDQPQLAILKNEGFRMIEHKAKIGCLYYCHAEPYEYCVGNVMAKEGQDDVITYQKINPTSRIDVFDASVFATCRLLIDTERSNGIKRWYGNNEEGEK